MATVRVEQFNPISQCWNTLYTIPLEKYVPSIPPHINKYSGPYRYQFFDDTGQSTTYEALTQEELTTPPEDDMLLTKEEIWEEPVEEPEFQYSWTEPELPKKGKRGKK